MFLIHLKMFSFTDFWFGDTVSIWIDGSEFDSGLIWVELLEWMLSLGSWIASPELMIAQLVALRL